LSVSSKLLDYSQVSLGNILGQFLNIDADKSSQKSNWFQRPLTEKQVQYAADDVRYLHQLESLLNNKIIHKKMMSWVQEEREFFESQDFENTENSNYFKPRDKDGMSEVQWFIFEKLIAYREKLAEEANKPSYQILDKDYLLSLAKSKNEIQSFYAESKAPKKLMNESFKNQLLEVLNKSKVEAIQLGLSLDKLVNPMLSKEEMSLVRSTKKERDSIVANIYKPIQSLIKRDFGENAAVYIMGNKLMTELASGSYLNLRAYKRELISKYADELNLKIELN
jgi:ribonuclease D